MSFVSIRSPENGMCVFVGNSFCCFLLSETIYLSLYYLGCVVWSCLYQKYLNTVFFLTERGLEGPRNCFITTPVGYTIAEKPPKEIKLQTGPTKLQKVP
jgi:hypothetical protein